jgi:uncharacterized membrane protein YqjE
VGTPSPAVALVLARAGLLHLTRVINVGMDKTLTAFIWVWVSMILLANIFGIWGLFASADSTDDAMQQFRESTAQPILPIGC